MKTSWVRAKLSHVLFVPIENAEAHQGRWLQVRPKAAHGRVRTTTVGLEGELIETIPRGFYLRSRFIGAVLLDPRATPV